MNQTGFITNGVFCALFFTLLFEIYSLTNITTVGKSNDLSQLSFNGRFVSCFFLTVFLIDRWLVAGYPPLSNFYESLLFLSWSFLMFSFFVESLSFNNWVQNDGNEIKKIQSNAFENREQEIITPVTEIYSPITQLSSFENSFQINKDGEKNKISVQSNLRRFFVFLFLSASLFVYTFATWRLPAQMQEISPLVPALQSNWLLMHVSIMILSYAALLGGSLFSIAYLVLESTNKYSEDEINKKNLICSILNILDGLSGKILSFAFPLLTLGIISGAVWANEAWGSYWSWDPKETWALITWFIFAIYLHLRLQKGWGGSKAAWVAVFGNLSVWICYLGVNLIGKGLHSYGWFSS